MSKKTKEARKAEKKAKKAAKEVRKEDERVDRPSEEDVDDRSSVEPNSPFST
jgi:hypothetical protein